MTRHLIRFYNLATVVVGTKCLTRILQFLFFFHFGLFKTNT